MPKKCFICESFEQDGLSPFCGDRLAGVNSLDITFETICPEYYCLANFLQNVSASAKFDPK